MSPRSWAGLGGEGGQSVHQCCFREETTDTQLWPVQRPLWWGTVSPEETACEAGQGAGWPSRHHLSSEQRHSIHVERDFIITVPFRLLGALDEMTAQKQRSWRRAPTLPVRARSAPADSPGATLEGSGETHTVTDHRSPRSHGTGGWEGSGTPLQWALTGPDIPGRGLPVKR